MLRVISGALGAATFCAALALDWGKYGVAMFAVLALVTGNFKGGISLMGLAVVAWVVSLFLSFVAMALGAYAAGDY